MGKMKENPRYNVITVRLNDQEYDEIIERAKIAKVSISTYVRRKLLYEHE